MTITSEGPALPDGAADGTDADCGTDGATGEAALDGDASDETGADAEADGTDADCGTDGVEPELHAANAMISAPATPAGRPTREMVRCMVETSPA